MPVASPWSPGTRSSVAENRGVAYIEPDKVEVHDIDFPTFELKDGPGVNPANVGRKTPHGAILRIVSTGSTLCGVSVSIRRPP